MFKIQKTEYSTRNFRIPTKLLEQLSEVAQQEDISVNKLVIQCCEYALERLNKPDDEQT